MTSLSLLGDQGIAPFQILLEERVLDLREPLLQFPVSIVGSHLCSENRWGNVVVDVDHQGVFLVREGLPASR